jgi:hypothetical protein
LACRFIRAEIVKAGGGSSATGLSAYIARDIRLDQSGERFNFAHRADELAAHGLILPAGAPEWAADAARVWREAERAEQTIDRATGEKRWKKGGQVAKHFTIALPREGTDDQRRELLLAFITQEIQPQKHGVAVEWAIHREESNPHAHLLISTRTLAGDGFGKKARSMRARATGILSGRQIIGIFAGRRSRKSFALVSAWRPISANAALCRRTITRGASLKTIR